MPDIDVVARNTLSDFGYTGGLTGANTAFGANAARAITTGALNAAFGTNALAALTTGQFNIAMGYNASASLTTGSAAISIGYNAGAKFTTQFYNIAIGYNSLSVCTASAINIAVGGLSDCTTGSNNTTVGGMGALTTGAHNTSCGNGSLFSLLTGNYNAALGFDAAGSVTGSGNTILGCNPTYPNGVTSGSNNTILGYASDNGITTGSGNTVIGANITSLTAALANAVVLGSGDGTIHADWNKTTANAWNLIGSDGTTTAAAGSIGEYLEVNQLNQSATVTTPVASPGVVNWATHGLVPGNTVSFSGGTLPTGITSGTVYYVINGANFAVGTFSISATPGGAAINFTGTSSGTQTGTTLVALTSGATNATNIAALVLSPGDWDIFGSTAFVPGSGTTTTLANAWCSSAGATMPTQPNHGNSWQRVITTGLAGEDFIVPLGRLRLLVTTSTPVYLQAQATFGASTLSVYGNINARRMV